MEQAAAPGAPALAVVAARYQVECETPLSTGRCRLLLEELVEGLTNGAWREGAVLIGHIKAILDAGEPGFLYASSTGDGTPVRVQGKMARETRAATLTVNVLVYGTDRARLEERLAGSIRGLADRYGFGYAVVHQ